MHEGNKESRLLLKTNAVESKGSFYGLTILWGRSGEMNSLLVTVHMLLFFPEFRRKNCASFTDIQDFISRWEVQCLFHFLIADKLHSLKWNILNALQHKGTRIILKATSAFIS